MQFRRILIPTDFSTASEWVFEDAVRLAAASGGELLILHVRMTWSSQPDRLRFPAGPELYEYAERHELELLRDRVRRANASVATRMLVRQAPDPSAEIRRAARDERVDLIVIATHGRHHVAHLLIGSTTLSVIRQPPVPVLAIRYGTRKRQTFDRVVVPLRPGDGPRPALEVAAAMAREVHLIVTCAESEHEAAGRLADSLRRKLPRAHSLVARADDAEGEILRYTNEVDADAIFLDAPDRGGSDELEIVRHAPVPVMVVPAAGTDGRQENW